MWAIKGHVNFAEVRISGWQLHRMVGHNTEGRVRRVHDHEETASRRCYTAVYKYVRLRLSPSGSCHAGHWDPRVDVTLSPNGQLNIDK